MKFKNVDRQIAYTESVKCSIGQRTLTALSLNYVALFCHNQSEVFKEAMLTPAKDARYHISAIGFGISCPGMIDQMTKLVHDE